MFLSRELKASTIASGEPSTSPNHLNKVTIAVELTNNERLYDHMLRYSALREHDDRTNFVTSCGLWKTNTYTAHHQQLHCSACYAEDHAFCYPYESEGSQCHTWLRGNTFVAPCHANVGWPRMTATRTHPFISCSFDSIRRF